LNINRWKGNDLALQVGEMSLVAVSLKRVSLQEMKQELGHQHISCSDDFDAVSPLSEWLANEFDGTSVVAKNNERFFWVDDRSCVVCPACYFILRLIDDRVAA